MLFRLIQRLRERYRVQGSIERHVIERAHSYDLGLVVDRAYADIAIERDALGGSKRIAAQAAVDAARARLDAPSFGF